MRGPNDPGASLADILETLAGAKRTPSQSVARHEAQAALKLGLKVLPDDQREAIELHCLQGQSLQEVANVMGRTPGAIRALVHRGKRKVLG